MGQNGKNAIPISEALAKTGFGIFNYVLIILGGLLMTCTYYETALASFILPAAGCDLELTNQEKGILSAIGYIGIIVSSHLWGFLADTKGRRYVILPAVLISSTISVLSSFSNTFWLLVLLRFLNGFFVSGSSATVFAYVGEFHTGHSRTRAVMASASVLSIGCILLPVLAWAIVNQSWSFPMALLGVVYKPWRLFIVACACPGVLCAIIIMFYPESPKFLMSIGKNEEALEVLRKMHKWNKGSGDFQIREVISDEDTSLANANKASNKSSSFLATFFRTMWRQTAPLFQRGLLLSTVLSCTIQFWIYVTLHGMFMWFPYTIHSMVEFRKNNPGNSSSVCDVIYAKQFQLESELQNVDDVKDCNEKFENQTFVFTIMMEFFYGMGFVIIGFLVHRAKKTHILFFVLFVFGSCGIWIHFIYNTTVALIVYQMLFLAGVGIQVMSEITVDLYPTNLRGMALCISLMFGRLGGVFGANFVAWLLATNCEMTFNIAGAGLMISGLLTFFIPKVKPFEKNAINDA
ncbi:synaptic vesicle glycoprotein 2B-like isoform X2 [Episyrphus balteatus]|uniref:synaptic vesicle glycoprotein 2B-like isoform X2 n=1 Tax=Episyrphus balteatus TaxID=286459 RepID=UPI002485E908|nr:synaptic vesicle glycoprotein 2B-like isoform X2 [Episyrphus balteatus]